MDKMASKPRPERQIGFKLNEEDRSGNGNRKGKRKTFQKDIVYDDLIL